MGLLLIGEYTVMSHRFINVVLKNVPLSALKEGTISLECSFTVEYKDNREDELDIIHVELNEEPKVIDFRDVSELDLIEDEEIEGLIHDKILESIIFEGD